MRNLGPNERKLLAKQKFDRLLRYTICNYGSQNADKLMFELERVIRRYRRSKKASKERQPCKLMDR